jgi:hypothetical protein
MTLDPSRTSLAPGRARPLPADPGGTAAGSVPFPPAASGASEGAASQTDFAAALLDPERIPPLGLVDPQGRPAGKRFDVYRNNVTVSLTDALEAGFPVLRQLLGEDFFRAMAREFLRRHPPESPLLMFYGAGMPAFLAAFPPVREYPYLPDVARLELALRRAYHAADVAPLAPQALAISPDRLARARLRLAPAVSALASPWPIHAIWRANVEGGPPPTMRAEEVLVARPALDPRLFPLPAGGAALVDALKAGVTLEAAVEAAGPGFDFPAALTALVQAGAIVALTEEP